MQKNGIASIAIAIIVALIALGSIATYSLTRHFLSKDITTSQNEPANSAQSGDISSPAPLAANNNGQQALPSASTKSPQISQTGSSTSQPLPSGVQNSSGQNSGAGTVQTPPPPLTTPPTAPSSVTTQPTTTLNIATTTTIPPVAITTTTPLNTLPLGAIQLFKCGDAVSFVYRNATVTYGTVKSPTTGACWLDRNLGAARVAQSLNDAQAYGDLFQWGRPSDGHQSRASATTTIRSTTDTPGHNKFIVANGIPYDWQTTPNYALWQGVNGKNNPCPPGWRIPTKDEWTAEQSAIDFLKLTTGGDRNANDYGRIGEVGSGGYYWSSTPANSANAGILVWDLYINHYNTTFMEMSARDGGDLVRCIKD